MSHFNPPSLTSTSQRVILPIQIKERAEEWVRHRLTGDGKPAEAPFKRMIDFWLLSIAWAIHKGIPPCKTPTGEKFVFIGPNSQDVNIEKWVEDLLLLIAARDFGLDDPRLTEPRQVMDLANCYAEVGSAELIRTLSDNEDLDTPKSFVAAGLLLRELER